MLWYKAWLETRWRFIAGLVLVSLSACSTVLAYPRVAELIAQLPSLRVDGILGSRVAEAAEVARTYRGYIWSEWFLQNLPQIWTLFAAMLGTGGLLSHASGSGTLHALSLPLTRGQLVNARAAVGLGELLVLALVPSLLVSALSPAIGQSYALTDAVIHALSLFSGGAVFFSLAYLLSTVFADIWRPFLAAAGLGLVEQVLRHLSPFSLFRLMSAEGHFTGEGFPWIGLLASAVVAAGMLHAAHRNVARQDF